MTGDSMMTAGVLMTTLLLGHLAPASPLSLLPDDNYDDHPHNYDDHPHNYDELLIRDIHQRSLTDDYCPPR